MPPRETAGFAKWQLADVAELRTDFRSTLWLQRRDGPVRWSDQLQKALHDDTSLESIFKVLDQDGDGRIDGLQFMAGVALCCRASFEEKVNFCFELFDFNLNAQLSETEMVMMMQCSVWGLLALVGASVDLEIDDFEKLGRAAILSFDLDASGNISYEEFTEWARKNREIMSCMDKLKKMSAEACEEGTGFGDEEDSDECDTDDDEFMAQEKQLGVRARRQHRPPKRIGKVATGRASSRRPTGRTMRRRGSAGVEPRPRLRARHSLLGHALQPHVRQAEAGKSRQRYGWDGHLLLLVPPSSSSSALTAGGRRVGGLRGDAHETLPSKTSGACGPPRTSSWCTTSPPTTSISTRGTRTRSFAWRSIRR